MFPKIWDLGAPARATGHSSGATLGRKACMTTVTPNTAKGNQPLQLSRPVAEEGAALRTKSQCFEHRFERWIDRHRDARL